MNKKGASMGGWMEGVLLVIMFMGIFSGGVILVMNNDYSQTHATGLGVNETDFANVFGNSKTEVDGGEAEFTGDQGLSLLSSWGIIKAILDVIWVFITGSFIKTKC